MIDDENHHRSQLSLLACFLSLAWTEHVPTDSYQSQTVSEQRSSYADVQSILARPLADKRRASISYQQLARLLLSPIISSSWPRTQFSWKRSSTSSDTQSLLSIANMRDWDSDSRATDSDFDVDAICDITNEGAESCVIRYIEDSAENVDKETLLAAVRRCNTYDPTDFFPVVVNREQVGWVSLEMLEALQQDLMQQQTCKLVDLSDSRANFSDMLVENALTRAKILAVDLAPGALSSRERTQIVAQLVERLVERGVIPEAKLRQEEQDVFPMTLGLDGNGQNAPSLRMERAAMIYFGVPSYALHINGWTRNPNDPENPQPYGMWIAKRSMSKATYAGLLDQMVAGGQPSSLRFFDNARKECEEEASLPAEVIERLRPTGVVSYRYATQKGLSTKILATYDLEMPTGLVPICSDGEVESFELLPITNVLRSIRKELPLWKPNSALVIIDFAMRHGFIDFDEPGYMEIAHLLRAGVTYKIQKNSK